MKEEIKAEQKKVEKYEINEDTLLKCISHLESFKDMIINNTKYNPIDLKNLIEELKQIADIEEKDEFHGGY